MDEAPQKVVKKLQVDKPIRSYQDTLHPRSSQSVLQYLCDLYPGKSFGQDSIWVTIVDHLTHAVSFKPIHL